MSKKQHNSNIVTTPLDVSVSLKAGLVNSLSIKLSLTTLNTQPVTGIVYSSGNVITLVVSWLRHTANYTCQNWLVDDGCQIVSLLCMFEFLVWWLYKKLSWDMFSPSAQSHLCRHPHVILPQTGLNRGSMQLTNGTKPAPTASCTSLIEIGSEVLEVWPDFLLGKREVPGYPVSEWIAIIFWFINWKVETVNL